MMLLAAILLGVSNGDSMELQVRIVHFTKERVFMRRWYALPINFLHQLSITPLVVVGISGPPKSAI